METYSTDTKNEETSQMSIDELDNHLYSCADIIRGPVDASDYKNYIIPLVFYGIFDGRFGKKMEKLAQKEDLDLQDERDREFLRGLCKQEIGVVIPKEYRWDELKNENRKLDEKLDNAFEEFQDQNPDVFTDIDISYSSEQAFNGKEGSRLLKRLINKIDEVNYEEYPVDVIGESYMNLVRKFSEQENGEFFTPETLSKLLVNILGPYEKTDASFHDPTAGSAGLLIQTAKHIYNNDSRFEQLSETTDYYNFTGQEVNPAVSRVGRMNLALHQINSEYRQGDSLSNPQFTDNGTLENFDYILANFPFSMRGWKTETKKRQNKYGDLDWAENGKLPHGNYGDFSFIMHMESQLSDDGKMATIIPHGVLFRNGDKKYREYLIENDLIEAIVGLPKGLFESTNIPSAILVLNKDKPQKRKNKIIVINGDKESKFYTDMGGDRTKLTDDGIKEITNIKNNWENKERISNVVSTDIIKENDYNLNIALYVDTTEPVEEVKVSNVLNDIQELNEEYNQLDDRLNSYMTQLKYNQGDKNE